MSTSGTPESGKGLIAMAARILRHEAATIPVTFIASIIVIAPVLYSAIDFFVSPTVITSLDTTATFKLASPIPGLTTLVRGIGFIVLQSAIAYVYVKTTDVIARSFRNIILIPFIIPALVYAWLSAYVSFVLWVMAASSITGGNLTLIGAFLLALLVLILFVGDRAADDDNRPVEFWVCSIFSIIVFLIIFGAYTEGYFSQAGN